jgi:hypothetical protein
MAYVGQTRARALIAQLAHLGIGECVVRNPERAVIPSSTSNSSSLLAMAEDFSA